MISDKFQLSLKMLNVSFLGCIYKKGWYNTMEYNLVWNNTPNYLQNLSNWLTMLFLNFSILNSVFSYQLILSEWLLYDSVSFIYFPRHILSFPPSRENRLLF